ncbi:DUF5054 domain-containing protein [Paenibacillus yanchengensis]|uniref:DUF5054 domain-containing protein n=1 Tax=Paenibacillus yanchengensis TaxID=2035833 RepID=A0ABW4YNG4_9BACL
MINQPVVMPEKPHIHVIFKTHLDIGYTDLANSVIARYKDLFFPKAIATAEHFAKYPEKGAFIWTTGAWLVDYVLKHGSEEEKQATAAAIEHGYLAWHGLPFTTYTELYDEHLFEYSLQISKQLDARFGKQTIAAKMTDVPGHTRSIITHMAKAGIKYLHLGVNSSSHVPHVPELFVWRNEDGSEIIVQYSKNYGNIAYVDGLDDVLYFAHTHDNHGPSSIEQIEAQFAQLRSKYPDAVIEASTLDRYAEKLWNVRHTLPVVTEEIGDSWIHGSSTDPYKLAVYRELIRLRNKWIDSGELEKDSAENIAFSDQLLMVVEHTWGVDVKRYLADYLHYEKAEFQQARKRDKLNVALNPQEYRYLEQNSRMEIEEMFGAEAPALLEARSYSLMEKSWQEQRDYLKLAVKALHHNRQLEAEQAIAALKPQWPVIEQQQQTAILSIDDTYQLGTFAVQFANDGSIIQLTDGNNKAWASTAHPLGLYSYETYSKADYDRWYQQYHVNWRNTHHWVVGDFGKPGMEFTKEWVTHDLYKPILLCIHHTSENTEDVVYITLKMPKKAVQQMGAPEKLSIEYRFSKQEPKVSCTLQWFNKDAHRLPEASWFSFSPQVNNANLWKLDKLGQLISPLDVVQGGNRNMHAVNSGVYYKGADGEVQLTTMDAALVCPGQRRLVQFDHSFAPLTGGMHFNLHNNVWGTNFPIWYEEDAKFRFELCLHSNRL